MEGGKIHGALGKVVDEINEIVEMRMSKQVERRSRSVSPKIGVNRRSVNIHNRIDQITARLGR